MPLTPGTRIGAYDVTGPLGAGGMGEVYRARDTRLDRDVALKVLPEAFTADPDRLARFEREARVLASLNHANIAQIHGFEETGGTRALVLELVEGPTLADRLEQGPIPLDEVLSIARQIARRCRPRTKRACSTGIWSRPTSRGARTGPEKRTEKRAARNNDRVFMESTP